MVVVLLVVLLTFLLLLLFGFSAGSCIDCYQLEIKKLFCQCLTECFGCLTMTDTFSQNIGTMERSHTAAGNSPGRPFTWRGKSNHGDHCEDPHSAINLLLHACVLMLSHLVFWDQAILTPCIADSELCWYGGEGRIMNTAGCVGLMVAGCPTVGTVIQTVS